MFRQLAWAVGSYRSGLPAVVTVRNESMGGFHQRDVSPCTLLEICVRISLEKSGNWMDWIDRLRCLPSFFFAGADNVIFERLAPGQDDLRQTTLDHLDVSHLLQGPIRVQLKGGPQVA